MNRSCWFGVLGLAVFSVGCSGGKTATEGTVAAKDQTPSPSVTAPASEDNAPPKTDSSAPSGVSEAPKAPPLNSRPESSQPTPPAPSPSSPGTSANLEFEKRRAQQALDNALAVQKTKTGGWRTAKEPASAFLKRVDERLSKASALGADTEAMVEVNGGRGMVNGKYQILDNKRFRVENFLVKEVKAKELEQVIGVADGQRYARLSGQNGWGGLRPVSTSRLTGIDLERAWPYQFSILMAASIGSTDRPLSAWLKQVSKPGSGYVVTAEEVVVKSGTRSLPLYRITASRAAKGATPQTDVQMVFEASKLLPLEARMAVKPAKGNPTRVAWRAAWKLNARGFDQRVFAVPKA